MVTYLFVFSDWGLFLLRVVLGSILIHHGLPKLKDLKGIAPSFESMGFKPGIFWVTVIALLEVVGGSLIVLGFLTQLIAILVAIQFLVIILKIKLAKGFSGYEFDLLILTTALTLIVLGSGSFSIDSFFRIFLY